MTVPSADDTFLGQEIAGTYRLVEILGKGGMAVVYRGRHLVTDQDVAIKVLPPDLVEQAEVKARFIGEARTLARLEHPNIVGLYNFLQEQKHLYIIMQYAEGETFDRIIEREGRIPVGEVVAVGCETLEALVYAHEREVVHRDIKPSNIVIRGDGALKVMDFGIAKIVGSTKLTQTGQTMGTVRYMSPEQVRGRRVDHRTDLYSLGVTLYESYTGRTPFDGDTHFDIMHKHLTEQPRPPSELLDTPPALEKLLLRSLNKDPAKRFQSAREFCTALRQVPVKTPSRRITLSSPLLPVQDASSSAPNVRSRGWRFGAPAAVALVLLLAAFAMVTWALLSDGQQRRGSDPTAHGSSGRTATSPSRPRWPAPHRIARHLEWKIDRRFAKSQLRVLSMGGADAEKLARRYEQARAGYAQFIAEEGIDLEVPHTPLNLAIMPAEVFAKQQGWTSPRYEAPARTLYLDSAKPNFIATDLAYGLALHFCVPLAELSNRRCVELAEGFERYMQARPPAGPPAG